MTAEFAHNRPRAPIFGRRAMVVSGHAAASLAGFSTLERGGTVGDALVAASAALSVVLGHATSIGGDCFLLINDAASGRTLGLNGSGIAPARAVPERFPGGIDVHGPAAPLVPGLVGSWEAIHRRFGRLRWQGLFDDAIDLAERHVVSQVLTKQAASLRAELAADAGCAALYLPEGRPIGIGTTLCQPALAATLRTIAANGADEFYRGGIAQALADYFENQGGLISAADLAGYQPLWVEPIATEYRGHRVMAMPPNSYGVLLLMQLNGLAAVDGADLVGESARRIGYQMKAVQAAFDHGVALISDPRTASGVSERLLGPETTAVMQDAVRGAHAPRRLREGGGTSCLLIADGDGNAACMVQSVFNVFGSMALDPRTGILFNNRMQGFTQRPGHANTIGPGKRPAHTLCPVMVHRDGRPRYVLASPGGLSQTLINAQILTNLIDGRMDVSAAVEAPRWCITKSGSFLIEPEFSEATVAGLAKLGHVVKRTGDDYYSGSAKAIEFLPSGNLAGASDHRREAFTLGA